MQAHPPLDSAEIQFEGLSIPVMIALMMTSLGIKQTTYMHMYVLHIQQKISSSLSHAHIYTFVALPN